MTGHERPLDKKGDFAYNGSERIEKTSVNGENKKKFRKFGFLVKESESF